MATLKEPPSCYDKALELIARRPHFARELRMKLAKRRYQDEEVGAALEKLASRGFLDEEETARAFVRERLRRGPVGRRRLAADLARRGADEAAVREALAELPEDDTGPARSLAERWLERSARPPGPARKAALARHLERRGFSARAIVAALDADPDEP